MAYGGDNTGVSSNNAAIAAAIADKIATIGTTANGIILFPAGDVKITSNVILPVSGQGLILTGAGVGVTTIKAVGASTAFSLSGGTNYGNPTNVNSTITSGLTAGSTTIQLASAVGYQADRFALVKLVDESVTPIVNVYAQGASNRTLTVFVTGVNSGANTVTISKPIPLSYISQATTGATLEQLYNPNPRYFGISHMTIEGVSGMQNGINMTGMRDGFIHRVEVKNHINRGIFADNCQNVTIRECVIRPANLLTNNTAGIVLQFSSYCHVDSNYARYNNPSIQVNYGTSANVFSDNYCDVIRINHGPHTSLNLYTRNVVTGYFSSDGYFGGDSEETMDGNWIMSGVLASLKRFSRNMNITRNINGTPGQTYTDDGTFDWGDPAKTGHTYFGDATPSTGDWWWSWDVAAGRTKRWAATLTTINSTTTGVITGEAGSGAWVTEHIAKATAWNVTPNFGITYGAVNNTFQATDITGDVITFSNSSFPVLPATGASFYITAGPAGFSEFDHDVRLTTLLKLNYYVFTGNIPAGEALGADTMPVGYDRTTKPATYGALAWPPFDSTNPGTPSVALIPPGFFEVNGYWPSDEAPTGGSITTPSLTVGTINLP